jgi:phage terminase large subunit GpA-like protein
MPPAFDARITEAIRRAWAPPPALSVSQLAERHLILSPEYSKIRGPLDLDLYPYLREILDRLHPDDPIRTVAFRGHIQGGKTVVAMGWLSAIIAAFPAPTLWVTDTESKAELFSKKRFDLMVRDSPTLHERVADHKSRNKDNTLLRKTFAGGDLDIVGAQSASRLTSNTYRWVVLDEVDDHRENVSHAGSSIALAMGRTTTYGDLAKTLIVSSPKVKGASEIDTWHDRGDRRVYRVPCVRCGELQPLEFRSPADGGGYEYRLVWDKGDPSSVHYVCRYCGGTFVETDKPRILPAGEWTATTTAIDPTVTSYGLNCLYLPLGGYGWADLARQWESAMARLRAGDPDEHRTVINTRLAESYETPGDTLDAHALSRLVEPDWGERIPAGVRVITCGTDVQDDRIETITIGWGNGWEVWILDYNVILSDPRMADAWARHDDLTRREYLTADGRRLRPAATCVDSGFLPQRVLEYTQDRRRRGVYAVKGMDLRGAIWDKKIRKTRTKTKQGIFYAVRTVSAKDDLAAALRVTEPGPRYVHIPDRVLKLHPDFLRQLASERRVKTRDRRGRDQISWEKVTAHARNEAWDAFVYALAAAHSLTMGGLRLDAPAISATATPTYGKPTATAAPNVEPGAADTSEHNWHPADPPGDPAPRGAPRRPRPPAPTKDGWLTGGRTGRTGRWL